MVEVASIEAPFLGVMARWYGLGETRQGGVALVVLPAGWHTPGGTIDADVQVFVLKGRLDFGGERVGGPEGGFLSVARGVPWPAIAVGEETLLFVSQGMPETIA